MFKVGDKVRVLVGNKVLFPTGYVGIITKKDTVYEIDNQWWYAEQHLKRVYDNVVVFPDGQLGLIEKIRGDEYWVSNRYSSEFCYIGIICKLTDFEVIGSLE